MKCVYNTKTYTRNVSFIELNILCYRFNIKHVCDEKNCGVDVDIRLYATRPKNKLNFKSIKIYMILNLML